MEQKKRDKYLLKNTLVFAIGNFGTKFISFFLVPLYTNILSTSDYGTVDLVSTICTVAVPMLSLNIGDAIMRFALDKDANQEKILSTGMVILGITSIISLALIPFSSLVSAISSYGIYVYLYTMTLAYSQIFLCYLRGREQLLHYSIGNIIHTFAIAVSNIILLVFLHKGIKGYLLAYIISNVATATYAFIIGKIYVVFKRFNFDIELTKKMAAYSIVLIPNSFMWWIMNSSDRIMVTSMVGVAANGIYAVAYKVPTLLSTVSNVFNQAWSYSAIKENESADKEEYSNAVYKNMVCTVTLAAGGLLMLMKPFLRFYAGKEYYLAWRYTPYLVIGFVFMTLGTFLSTSYTVNKDSWGFLISGTVGALVNVILNFLLIPYFEAAGAAFATCISYFSVFLFRVFNTRKYIHLNVFRKKDITGIVLCIFMGFSMFLEDKIGQIVLIVEYLIILVLYREFWLSILMGLKKKIVHR